MKTQSCQPCAKRKVRCDRQEPCSNCKRRKQDKCVYPEISPIERIKELEGLVESLRASGWSTSQPSLPPTSTSPFQPPGIVEPPGTDNNGDLSPQHGNHPRIMTEDEEPVYLDSFSWHSWSGKTLESSAPLQSRDKNIRLPLLASTGSSALQSIILRDHAIELATSHPVPRDAINLWDIFLQRAHPMMKISFDWELAQLRDTAITTNGLQSLSFSEHAFIFAVYLLSVTNLSEDECSTLLGQPKSLFLASFQTLCEQALVGSNFLGASDLTSIQALTMYINAGVDRLETKSLWSMMGIVIRNSERCGLQRDGSLLGLSPYETEKRRRVWWQLQHLDLALGVKSGSKSLTLTAAWDTGLPLNIEDEDINPHTREAPKERKGLTGMSFCLWTYWVIKEQRSFCRSDGTSLGFSWVVDSSLSGDEKDAFIDRLEAGLNKQYVQYCDPIRPRDMLVQIFVRAFVSGIRRVILLPVGQNGRLSDLSEDQRNKLLDICMCCLEYDVLLHSNPSINYFRARLRGYFQWAALVYVLVEAHRQHEMPRAEQIWALLSSVYATNKTLSEFQDDRRKSYAIELMSMAWNKRQVYLIEEQQRQRYGYEPPRKPAFLFDLENRLMRYIEGGNVEAPSKRKLDVGEPLADVRRTKKVVLSTGREPRDQSGEDIGLDQITLDPMADFDFDAIDWSFWEPLPQILDPSTNI